MLCPFCKADNDRVIDSRSPADGSVTRRRRECLACSRRFTTYERVEEFPLQVVKKNGSREPFDRGKILAGIERACEKRPLSHEEQDRMVDRIEGEVMGKFDTEVPSSWLGELAMRELRQADQVAYIRFASVYRQFGAPMDFIREAQPIAGLAPTLAAPAPPPSAVRRRGRPVGRKGLGQQKSLFNGSLEKKKEEEPPAPAAPSAPKSLDSSRP